MAGADGVGGDEKRGDEGDVDQGIGNCVRAGGTGEIEAGGVVHGTDVPQGGEEAFEGLACTAKDAEKKRERWKKERAGEPGEQT